MRRVGKWLLIAFLCYHMTGVLAMTIPGESTLRPAVFMRETVRHYTDSYLFWTSQWQYWNLFAPNPTNWITEHRVDAFLDGDWRVVGSIGPDSVNEWNRSDELKVQEGVEEENHDEMRIRYLMDACIRMGVPAGTTVRLVFRTRILDRETGKPVDNEWDERGTSVAFCPPKH